MSFLMTNSRTNNIKWSYYEKHNIITKSKFGNILIINIMMYVTIDFHVKTLFTPGYCSIAPQNCELSGEINVKMCIIEKSKKIHSKKTLS